MNRIFTLLLLCLLCFSVNANAQVQINGIYYFLKGDTKEAEVTSNPNKYSGNIIIPSVVGYSGIRYRVTSIGREAFRVCSGLTSVTIPNSVTSIGGFAFFYCTGLTSITIPNSVTSIGYDAFEGCTGLTSVTIPNSVTSIEIQAFYNCSGLTSVTIPNSVKSIGGSAFYGCSGLKEVHSLIEQPFALSISVFFNSYSATLYVPAGTKAKYQAADGWKNFKNIVEDNITFADANVKAICVANWDTNNDGELSKTEADAVTSLEGVFSSNKAISSFKELQYFEGLKSIGGSAFSGCSSLTSITIPNSVTSIGDTAFSGCSSLTSITIPNSVTSIGGSAFYGCSGLTSITIPNSVTSIASGALANATNLAAVVWEPATQFTELMSNPNLLLYVSNADYAPAGIQNVVVNGVAEHIVLTEAQNGNGFYCPEEFTARSISLTHKYSMVSGLESCQGWETIVLPFDVQSVTHATKGMLKPFATWQQSDSEKPFWLYELSSGGWTRATGIRANIPYIISMPNNEYYRDSYRLYGYVTFSANNVKVKKTEEATAVSAAGKTLVPNFRSQSASSEVFALNVVNDYDSETADAAAGSQFIRQLRNVHPFEAYMTVNNTTRGDVIPLFEEYATRIGATLNDKGEMINDKWYSFDGRKLEEKPTRKGVYIMNGKKVVIR